VTALLPAVGASSTRAAEATAPAPASQAGGAAIERLFQAADRDPDGRLSPAEVESWPRVSADFLTIDTDQDGFISRQELGAALFRWWQQQNAAKSAPDAPLAGRAEAGGPGAKSRTSSPGATRGGAGTPASAARVGSIDQHSPQFRGPRGDGVAHGANLPDTWSATSNAHIAWCQRRAAPYVTSPLVYDGILYVLLDGGFLAAYDARTGAEICDKQRFPGGRAAFTASPWAYDGKIFCLAATGETHVVAAGRDNIRIISSGGACTPADRALLSELSAKPKGEVNDVGQGSARHAAVHSPTHRRQTFELRPLRSTRLVSAKS